MVFSGWSFLQLGLEAAQQISVDTGVDFLAENLLGALHSQGSDLLTQGFAGLDCLLLGFSLCSGNDLVAFFGGTNFGFFNDAIARRSASAKREAVSLRDWANSASTRALALESSALALSAAARPSAIFSARSSSAFVIGGHTNFIVNHTRIAKTII
jgi:hypothetical protein